MECTLYSFRYGTVCVGGADAADRTANEGGGAAALVLLDAGGAGARARGH